MKERRVIARLWWWLAAIVLAIPIVPFALFGELAGTDLSQYTLDSEAFVAGALLLAGDIFLPVPSSVVATLLGARLGFLTGAASVSLGLCAGSIAGFYAGRIVGLPLVRRHASPAQMAHIVDIQDRYAHWALAVFRAVPVLSEASVIAAGALGLRPKPAILVLITSNLALGLAYSFLGSLGSSSAGWMLAGAVGLPALGIAALRLLRTV